MSPKFLLSTIASLLLAPMFGQVNWTELETLSESKKAAYIETAHSELKRYLHDFDEGEYNLMRDCHVIDMDNDGDFDIIYNGWDGVEGDFVLVLRKDSSQFVVQLSEIGTVTEFFLYDGKLQSVSILNVACCGAIHTMDLQYRTLDTPMRFQIENAYVYHQSTIYPEEYSRTAYREYFITSPELNMRYSPRVDTTSAIFDVPNAEKTNVIATFSQGTRGWIIGKAIDDNGDVWYYMQMKSYPVNTVLTYPEYDELYYCGWMNAKYLAPVKAASLPQVD